ncbi:anti-sigma factor [Jiella pelagia]|uniref:Regulator of SigK n=1 Tax=Jiella pelagia TaxID=2986949 RepID=A0ABY7BYC2_9HYPH|nr:anti-sigma factor [Jiella pelagia]WAP67660.1 anti-sigma factor [Jiella pelagia]
MSDLRSEDGGEADLAAEYSLGVLDGAERRAAQRRIERDPAFAGEVEAWGARFAPLYEAIEPVEPPVGVWPRIVEDLARMRRVDTAGTQPAKPKGRRVAGIWQWIGLSGMGLAAASLAALIVVAGGLGEFGPQSPQAVDTILAGTLMNDRGEAMFTVVFYHEQDHDVATLIPVSSSSDADRVPELWVVPSGGTPRSLGMLHNSQPVVLALADRQALDPDAALAVSMEPAGGSPTGLPTGPVVAHGELRTP